jgi:hypothetical protein
MNRKRLHDNIHLTLDECKIIETGTANNGTKAVSDSQNHWKRRHGCGKGNPKVQDFQGEKHIQPSCDVRQSRRMSAEVLSGKM